MSELPEGNWLIEIIRKLAPDPKKVAAWIDEVREENPELRNDDLADFVGDKIVWTYTSQGAALALPGAIPGLGTIIQISTELTTASVDVALMVRNQTYLVFALGAIYGYHSREMLIQDTLICIGLWTNALSITKAGAIKIGTKVAEANFKKHFPAKILQAINRKVSTTVFTKYGTKRGGVALGKLIPFGVGVLVGGGFSYITMKNFKRRTIEYFCAKRK
jgi:hypothetical protein